MLEALTTIRKLDIHLSHLFARPDKALFLRLWAVLLSGLISVVAHTAVITHIETYNYISSPRSMKTFMEDVSMNSGHPRYAATTRWNTYFHYGFIETEEACRFRDVKVYLDIIYHMPKLTYSPDPAVTRTFKRYYDHLLEHEKGHGDSGRLAAEKIDQLLQTAKAENCVDLVKQSRQAADKIVKVYRNRDRNYDLITDHGRRQERLTPGMLERP